MKTLSDIGMVGLGVMGSALAKNIAGHGFAVSVYNREYKRTRQFVKQAGDLSIVPAKNYKAFVASIARPRKIMLMVTAGDPVDAVIKSLLPHLSKGDIIIDGGNSHYRDTERRQRALKKKGIHLIGCGVSGGEAGALNGPSLMPSGPKRAWRSVRPIFEAIAAKDFSGKPCVAYLGDKGAGQYVKMVHNGIEYAVMQLIAETYGLFRDVYNLSATEIADVFQTYNRGNLRSFLLDQSIAVLKKDCKEGKRGCLVDMVLDVSAQKGTGAWSAVDALERGVAAPTIAEAVFARHLSGQKERRMALHEFYAKKRRVKKIPRSRFEKMLGRALTAAQIISFAQGFSLIERAAKEEKWKMSFAEVARIWQGGCIIRTNALDWMQVELKKKKETHILLLPTAKKTIRSTAKDLQSVVSFAAHCNAPLSAYASAFAYIASLTTDRLSANLVAALRDSFGAHGYERTDKPGTFHTDWNI